MSQTKTHWKKAFNPDYLGAYSLDPGQELILTIKNLKTEKVKNADGREDECLVCHFSEPVKPMILNVTNCKIIHRLYSTPYVEEWVGKQIQVYVAKVKAFGDTVDALRVRPFVPTGKKKLEANRLSGLIDAIQTGNYTIAKAKESFDLTADQLKQIEAADNKQLA